ncbi:SDR family oxidoreductase [Streptomyces sp. NRRL F-5126]|uniref:SDR family oxidoreductase n=1 Tax=Streptomyces sp. NRRL F-5126 TaxID=1463857 RepID=UPI0004CA86AC|nr:aldehyde reductase [Streptomyces sp. NRRL F-5126]
MNGETVLVTGGSGFVGAHAVLRLLETGRTVRTTVRAPDREQAVRAMLRTGGAEPGGELEFAAADLTSDQGWADAVQGCAYVLHVASPFPATVPRDENELIVPARDGTLRVLRAARDAGVRRVVLTSSLASISYGHADVDRTFTEEDWTDLGGAHVAPYAKSKTIAERAAWDFVEREGGPLELAVVNPVGVLGPVLGPDFSTSVTLIQRLLDRDMPALPRLSFSFVDVRDVVDLHLRAMTDPAARGERFLAAAGAPMWVADVARVLRDGLGPAGERVPTRRLPDILVRLAARADASLRGFVPELGKVKKASADKARNVLGWRPRTNEEAIIACAESLIALGLVKSDS